MHRLKQNDLIINKSLRRSELPISRKETHENVEEVNRKSLLLYWIYDMRLCIVEGGRLLGKASKYDVRSLMVIQFRLL